MTPIEDGVKIHIANADDWVGVYFDGKLVYQNHNITAEQLLELLQLDYTDQWFDGELDQWGNWFPETQAELTA